mgnify:FL=1
MSKILITGASGQLGSEIKQLTKQSPDYIFTDIEELDICSKEAGESFLDANDISSVLNCAAYTNVEGAESDFQTAKAVNGEAVAVLAQACADRDLWLIHISPDYVFDGSASFPYREADRPHPQNAYGRTKYMGETAIHKSGCKSVIIRTGWLYSSFGKNFVKSIIAKGMENDSIKVVYDQKGTPTYARDLAEAILKILPQLKEPRYGEVFHYSNMGECSWADFAAKILASKHIECVVEPCSTEDYPSLAKRPACSVLDKSLIIKTFGLSIPTWERSLSKMLRLV